MLVFASTTKNIKERKVLAGPVSGAVSMVGHSRFRQMFYFKLFGGLLPQFGFVCKLLDEKMHPAKQREIRKKKGKSSPTC